MATLVAGHEQRGALPPPVIPSRCIAGLQRGQQPAGERRGRVRAEPGLFHRGDDAGADEDVALDRVAVPAHPAGPVRALPAGVRRGPAMRVQHAELAHVAPGVAAGERAHRLLRGGAVREQGEAAGPVGGVGPGLGGQRADAGTGGGDDGAHGEVLAGDGDAELGPAGIARDDREGHARSLPRQGRSSKPGVSGAMQPRAFTAWPSCHRPCRSPSSPDRTQAGMGCGTADYQAALGEEPREVRHRDQGVLLACRWYP